MVAVVTSNASDERIRLAAAGDRDAANQLLLELLPRVRNLIRYLIPSDAEADDVAQDALVSVVRALGTYRGEGRFESWVDRIVARATFAHIRERRTPREQPEPPESVTGPDEYLARRRVVALLDRLPTEQRVALVLHHVLEMSVPEIAEELSLSSETVRSRLRLGRTRLRESEESPS